MKARNLLFVFFVIVFFIQNAYCQDSEIDTVSIYQKKLASKVVNELKKLNATFDSIKMRYDADKLNIEKNPLKSGNDNIRERLVKNRNELVNIFNKQKNIKEAITTLIDKRSIDTINKKFDDKKFKDFKTKEAESKTDNTKLSDHLTLLNAYNFDFNNTSNNSYLGHVNVFFPFSDSSPWAINTGLMKINYNSINNNPVEREDRTLVNPLDEVKIGTKYNKAYNKYNIETQVSSWSAYMQLLHKFKSENKNYAIFWHLHTELLISTIKSTTKINTIKDSIYVMTTNNDVSDYNYRKSPLENPNITEDKLLSGYFGAGFTGDFTIEKGDDYKLRYFIQGTFGRRIVHTIKSSGPLDGQDALINEINENYQNIKKDACFYLVRSYISSDYKGMDIQLGVEVRGLVPRVSPLNAFYIGLNTNLESLSKLFIK